VMVRCFVRLMRGCCKDAWPTKAPRNRIWCQLRELYVQGKDPSELDHKIPESLRAFCKIVSLTAAKTSRMFDVSVACVK